MRSSPALNATSDERWSMLCYRALLGPTWPPEWASICTPGTSCLPWTWRVRWAKTDPR